MVKLKGPKVKFEDRAFYKAEDLAKLLNVNIKTIYRYLRAKRLIAYKIGGEYRIAKKEFNNFLESVKTK